MNYETFEDHGDFAAVYFILDQSRHEPPAERARLMFKAGAFLRHDEAKQAREELMNLANELCDCEQDAQRLIASLRCDNAALLAENAAVAFLLARLESCDLATKIELMGNADNMTLITRDTMRFHDAWSKANHRIGAFEQRLELFMFRLRTYHWRISNKEAEATDEVHLARFAPRHGAPASAG